MEWWPLRKYDILLSGMVKATLIGKIVFFPDVMKDFEMRKSSWIIQLGPKSNYKCPHKELGRGRFDTDRRDNLNREVEMSACGYKLRNDDSYHRMEKAEFSPKDTRGKAVLQIPGFRISGQNFENKNICP